MIKTLLIVLLSMVIAGVTTVAFSQGAGYDIYFNGINQYVEMTGFSVTSTSGFTMECWVNIFAGTGDYQFFVGDENANYRLGMDPSNHPYINFGDRTDQSTTSFTFNNAIWYHYAMVGYQNPDSTLHADLYVNGRLIFSANSASKSYLPYNVARIGMANGYPTNGTIDEVRIWNAPRTAQQLRESMHLQAAASDPNLLGYWRFDEGGGPTAHDLSTHGNDGTLMNSPSWANSSAPLGAGVSATGYATPSMTPAGTPGIAGLKWREKIAGGVPPINFPGENLSIAFNSITAIDTMVATLIYSPPSGAPSYAGLNIVYNRYWFLDVFGSGAFNVNETYDLGSGSISAGDSTAPNNLKLFNRGGTDAGGWTAVDSGTSATRSLVTFNSVTVAGQYIIGSTGNSPLPVQLASLSATVQAASVKLEWSTISETNNLGWYVERRLATSSSFAVVSDLIPGAGTSLALHNYSWTDNGVGAGSYVYHVRQVDLDGTLHFSQDVDVDVSGALGVVNPNAPATFHLGQSYPNPFNPATTITFTVAKTEHAALRVFTLLGQSVATLFDGTAEPGKSYSVVFPPAGRDRMASGTYLYRLVTDSRVETKSMFLLK